MGIILVHNTRNADHNQHLLKCIGHNPISLLLNNINNDNNYVTFVDYCRVSLTLGVRVVCLWSRKWL